MGKKTRNRRYSDRLPLRYRILIGNNIERVVGQAQWHRHLKIGNLIRESDDPRLAQRLAEDERLALIRSGLIAYENDNSQLCFESPAAKPAPIFEPRLEAKTQYPIIVANLLKQEPTLPKSERSRRIAAIEPLLRCGDAFGEEGEFVLY